jgi:hypothetical protein
LFRQIKEQKSLVWNVNLALDVHLELQAIAPVSIGLYIQPVAQIRSPYGFASSFCFTMSRSLKTRLRHLKEDVEENDNLKTIQSHLPPLNFITVHYAYFIVTCMVFSLVFWGSSDPARSISYTDSLFLVVSAMTEAGLNTVNLSQMTTFQQIILWLLILIGSSIFVSIGTTLARKHAFELRFKHVVKLQKEHRRGYRRNLSISVVKNDPTERPPDSVREAEGAIGDGGPESRDDSPRDQVSPPSQSGSGVPSLGLTHGVTRVASTEALEKPIGTERAPDGDGDGGATGLDTDRISFMPRPTSATSEHRRVLAFVGVGAHPNSTSFRAPHAGGIYHRGRKMVEEGDDKEEPLESWYPHYLTPYTTGRNGQFFGLSKAEREHLGGVEYRAIEMLSWIVPIYFVVWQLLGCLGLGAYMAHNKADTARNNGINPW